jgi:hypothetical protein
MASAIPEISQNKLLDNFPDGTGQSLRSAGFTESDASAALAVFGDDAGTASAWMWSNNHLDFRTHVRETTHLWRVLIGEMAPPALPAGTVHVPAAAGHLVDGSAILRRMCTYEENIICETNCRKGTICPANQAVSTCSDEGCDTDGGSVVADSLGAAAPAEDIARAHLLVLKSVIKSRLAAGMKLNGSEFGADTINTRADFVAKI